MLCTGAMLSSWSTICAERARCFTGLSCAVLGISCTMRGLPMPANSTIHTMYLSQAQTRSIAAVTTVELKMVVWRRSKSC